MVFTGIVEEIGTVDSIENLQSADGGVSLVVQAKVALDGVQIGDSIAVNGTCLTITQLTASTFTFGLAPETLRRTNLGNLTSGTKVNLERGMSAASRYGGHVVQAHIDCTGTITEIEKEKDALLFTIGIPREFMKLVVERGYIAVDGASLTVCAINDDENTFSFMMIPHTQANVVTANRVIGDLVNIEVDITGKYIDRILAARLKQTS